MQEGYVNERDEWTSGATITSPENLAKIAEIISRTVLVVEHCHYRGAQAPTRLFFEEKDEFLSYLDQHARPGDAFRVWPFDLCNDANAVVIGKYPDNRGRVPKRGAY